MTRKSNSELQEVEIFCPKNRMEWRQWLEKNHIIKQSVWLVYFKKNSGNFTLSWSEAVDEALCFGWIDSTAKSIDDKQYKQFFTKRKPKSVWSKINKDKIERLCKEGLISKAGFDAIEIAKENGSWTILDDVESLNIPLELQNEFECNPNAKKYFQSLSNSVKKQFLYWIVSAKRDETKQKRIDEIIHLANQNQKPKHIG
jgi:uncharacterized protein YdeI (YjbR/CyaY-like superfamily)